MVEPSLTGTAPSGSLSALGEAAAEEAYEDYLAFEGFTLNLRFLIGPHDL